MKKLNLRDYFAIRILQSELVNDAAWCMQEQFPKTSKKELCKKAYSIADEMIKQRSDNNHIKSKD